MNADEDRRYLVASGPSGVLVRALLTEDRNGRVRSEHGPGQGGLAAPLPVEQGAHPHEQIRQCPRLLEKRDAARKLDR